MWKTVVLATLIAAVAAAPATATLTRNAALEQKAQQVRGTHVDIWCEDNQAVWDQNLGAGAQGFTSFVGQYTLLSPNECANLNAGSGVGFDVAVYIFTHELMHTAGISNEADAECMNLFLFRYELRKWWGYTLAAAETAWQRGLTAHNALPAVYQGCTPLPADVVSVANGL